MFSQACVKNSVHREGGVSGTHTPSPWACIALLLGMHTPSPGHGCPQARTPLGTPPPLGTHAPRHAFFPLHMSSSPQARMPPPPHRKVDNTRYGERSMSGRYVSYRNAFLLLVMTTAAFVVLTVHVEHRTKIC